MQGHVLHVVGVGDGWVKELPGLVVGGGEAERERKESSREREKMKIAWRYERLAGGGDGAGAGAGRRGAWFRFVSFWRSATAGSLFPVEESLYVPYSQYHSFHFAYARSMSVTTPPLTSVKQRPSRLIAHHIQTILPLQQTNLQCSATPSTSPNA